MDKLPDELILHIIAFLEPSALCSLSLTSTHFLRLSRDPTLWKHLCFTHSATEQRRRRLASSPTNTTSHDTVDPRLAELIRAADTLSADFDVSVGNRDAPGAELQEHVNKGKRDKVLLANWDPSYRAEKVDWYKEFVERHAEVRMRWFQGAGGEQDEGSAGGGVTSEATGAGILFDQDGFAGKLVAPMENGSIKIWDARAQSETQGRCVGASEIGMLAGKGADLDMGTRLEQSATIMTDTGAVECVSIDSATQRGFFAVQNTLNEVDLHTLQLISRTPFPFPITALSEATPTVPLTIGTNWTLHLHDPRKPHPSPSPTHTELLNSGTATSFSSLTSSLASHVSLAQPGALSILHMPSTRPADNNGDIWVAGRFTSLLNFDRRFFPRLRGTIHSGARLSSLTALPHPFIPHSLRLAPPYGSPAILQDVKDTPGYTMIAAGEYKGKGSLELYSLSSHPGRGINSSDSRSTARDAHALYQNRQTASRSKLLSVACHGTRLVTSDGDGVLKWFERDAVTPVRQFNINHIDPVSGLLLPDEVRIRSQTQSAERVLINPHSVSGTAGGEDIVKKILPTAITTTSSSSSTNANANESTTPGVGQDNLALWTGDGKLGTVGFGVPPWDEDVWLDAVERFGIDDGEREREKRFQGEMRRALEGQARELRWLGGYGLA
ncbi:hypothetical protein NX059_009278 [Plenodomus lindquistii]|nr:hypothetical protein NX059_009278 [Plenodomus lindquistii]